MGNEIIYFCTFSISLDFDKDLKKQLPRDKKEREERKRERQSKEAVNLTYYDTSIFKAIRLLRMNDRQSELEAERERRDSGTGDVLLVERHLDDDLRDVVDPDPNDIEFQSKRLKQGELTKKEKKRWKRRYKGEAVFMVGRIKLFHYSKIPMQKIAQIET